MQTDDRDGIVARPLGRAAAESAGHPTDAIDRPDDVPGYAADPFVAPEPDPDARVAVTQDTTTVTDDTTTVTEDMATIATDPVVSVDYGPGPQQGGPKEKEIVVSISASALWAYDNGTLLASTLVSTGVGDIPETVTPLGYFSILSRYDVQDMQGVLGGEAYFVPEVPWVMYFDDLGNAIHGAYWHYNFGTPMSPRLRQPADGRGAGPLRPGGHRHPGHRHRLTDLDRSTHRDEGWTVAVRPSPLDPALRDTPGSETDRPDHRGQGQWHDWRAGWRS